MSNPTDELDPEPGQTLMSVVLPIAGVLFIAAAICAFLAVGWVVGICLLAVAAVLFALGGILDLLHEILKSLRRLEAKSKQKTDKP
jgi:hypothetical protein